MPANALLFPERRVAPAHFRLTKPMLLCERGCAHAHFCRRMTPCYLLSAVSATVPLPWQCLYRQCGSTQARLFSLMRRVIREVNERDATRWAGRVATSSASFLPFSPRCSLAGIHLVFCAFPPLFVAGTHTHTHTHLTDADKCRCCCCCCC